MAQNDNEVKAEALSDDIEKTNERNEDAGSVAEIATDEHTGSECAAPQDIDTLTISSISVDSYSTDSVSASDEIKEEFIFREEPKILTPDEIFSAAGVYSSVSDDNSYEEPFNELTYIEPLDQQFSIPELTEYEDEDEDDDIILTVDAAPEPYDPKKPRKIDGRFDFLELFVFTLVIVMLITTFFFRHSIVDGVSMENTLIEGEHLIISDVFYTPKRGDIIVCEDHTTAISKPIVKRVIATAGETVLILHEDGENRVYIDGVLLDEDYVHIDDPTYKYAPLQLTVPEGEIFVMGDHRNESTDSRAIGTVSEDSVLGRVLIRFYPFNKFGKVK